MLTVLLYIAGPEYCPRTLISVLGPHLVVLFFFAWHAAYAAVQIRRARRLAIAIAGELVAKLLKSYGKMDYDEVIGALLSIRETNGDGTGTTVSETHPKGRQGQEEPGPTQGAADVCCTETVNKQKHRERLAALAVGGQSKEYGLIVRGKPFTADQIDALDDAEIEGLYARYEGRL